MERKTKIASTSGLASSRLSGSLTVTTMRFGPARTTDDWSLTTTAVRPLGAAVSDAAGDGAAEAGAGDDVGTAVGDGAAAGGVVSTTSAARPLMRAAMTSGPAPNQIRWRSRPS